MIFGLVVSVPIIVWGSQLVMKVMDRYPVTIVIGAGLLGWIAGDMVVTDVVTKEWVNTQAKYMHWVAPAIATLLVIVVGKMLAARQIAKVRPVVDLVDENTPKQ